MFFSTISLPRKVFKREKNKVKKMFLNEENIENMKQDNILKGSVREKLKGYYRLMAKNKHLLLLLVESIRKKLFKTTHTEKRSVHSNSESCNIQLGS